MKILFLGDENSSLISYLEQAGETVLPTTEKINANFIDGCQPEFIVSYGYKHIIKSEIIDKYPNKAINLHISLLPWNRGADPNFWSFIDNSPKGVTIHYLDNGVDTGDIIAQKQVEFSKYDTLRTSYHKLHHEIQTLFKDKWANIRSMTCGRKKQSDIHLAMQPHHYIDPTFSYHRLMDKERIDFLLAQGWDTPISVLEEYVAESQLSGKFFDDIE